MNDQSLMDHAVNSIEAGSKSFAAASRLFDPETRRSAVMLYAWCRHCDDVVDGQEGGRDAVAVDAREVQARLAGLIEQTHAVYAGRPATIPAFAAFQDVVRRHDLRQAYALDHLAGFAMDADDRQYRTLDDLLEYCYHVAGVVGLMMAQVMGVKDEATLDRACDLGMAFQLTNIARDIVEDAAIGRCYLPQQWLDELGIARERLADVQYRERLAVLGARLVDLAEPYYLSAEAGIAALPRRSAWAVATAKGVYREIGVKVKAAGAGAWDRRISTSRADKLRLVISAGWQALASREQSWPARNCGLWSRPGRTCAADLHASLVAAP